MGSPRDWMETVRETVERIRALIGSPADTGGSATAGTIMGKENAIIEKVNLIEAEINESKIRYIPSETVQRSLYTEEKECTRSENVCAFEAEHDGVIRISFSAKQGSSNPSKGYVGVMRSSDVLLNAVDGTYGLQSDVNTYNLLFGAEGTVISGNALGSDTNPIISPYGFGLKSSGYRSYDLAVPVKKGDIIAVVVFPYSASTSYSIFIKNLKIRYDIATV